MAFKMPMTRGVSRSNRWPRRMKWETLTAQRCNAEAGEGTGKALWEKTGKEDGQELRIHAVGVDLAGMSATEVHRDDAAGIPALTLEQYDGQVAVCAALFLDKMHDYGTAWRVLRPSSLTDQIFIKAQRIRTLQEGGEQKVEEGIQPEFVGIVNYCMMALLQLELSEDTPMELDPVDAERLYRDVLHRTRGLMMRKNHDYGEAWRDMRVSSLTDLILMKLLRIKQLEDLEGGAKVSEGVDAGYMDMANYALFALIHLAAGQSTV